MRRVSLADAPGSVARALDQLGEWWTLMIINEAFLGALRFEEFQTRLGVARNILARRLDGLVGAGILDRVPYQVRPLRHEYRLTDRGRDLFAIVTAIRQWGDKWLQQAEAPLALIHTACGREAWFVPQCSSCGGELNHRNTKPRERSTGQPPGSD